MRTRVILQPENMNVNSGYGYVVRYELKNFRKQSDKVMVVTDDVCEKNIIKIRQNSKFEKLINCLLLRPPAEVSYRTLKKTFEDNGLDPASYHIYCGDIIFYRAVNGLVGDGKFEVNLHNCYLRLFSRYRNIHRFISLRFLFILVIYSLLEAKVIANNSVTLYTISKEDYLFLFKRRSDIILREPFDDLSHNNALYNECDTNKLVWLGSVSAHKLSSLRFFVTKEFPRMQKQFPDLELHLFGKNTKKYFSRFQGNGVYVHGFWEGEDQPFGAKGIYINPDLTGGGIKIKVLECIINNYVCITTPYGFEGFPLKYSEGSDRIYVADMNEWTSVIKKLKAKYS